MKKFFNRFTRFFSVIRSKIAFYPTVLAFMGFAFSFLMIYAEELGISKKLLEFLPQLVMEDGDTAKTVLSVCIGGLISMMVFSFSMVMLLLSQASSNFSPRLLPGLISDKRNQIVLGSYLATIIYNIFTLFSIESTGDKYTLPGFSVLLGIVATISCFGAFIYFVHTISQSIQINHILDNIFSLATKRLSESIQIDLHNDVIGNLDFPDSTDWPYYCSTQCGYLQNVSNESLIATANSLDCRVYITVPKGMYVLKKVPFIKSERALSPEEVEMIMACLNFDRNELIEDNYILAFKQITEIILKAMSPGVNDPGTAINGIDYLTSLFELRMQKRDSGLLVEDDKAVVKVAVIHFEELMYNIMASLRTYCKHDPIIMQKLLWMLSYLSSLETCDPRYSDVIDEEMKLLLESTEFKKPKDSRMIKAASKGLSGMEGITTDLI